MKKVLVLASLTAVALMVCSCDFLRRAAGRPTSDEIEAKREYIQKTEAQKKAQDELRAKAEQYTKDSLAAWDYLNACGREIMSSRKFNRMDSFVLDYDYFLMVGSFSNESNALKLVSEVVDGGYNASTLSIRPGMTAVGICGSNDIVEFSESLKEVWDKPFCPSDAWILVVER